MAPTFDKRVDAAKAAAPYYAPKLATQTLQGPDGGATRIGGAQTTDVKAIDTEINAVIDANPELAKFL